MWAPDHPRSRGEYAGTHADGWAIDGSSPLSRGIPMRTARTSSRYGIIPALAGNTRTSSADRTRCRDHPRSRGEYLSSMSGASSWSGSSPLSRGIRHHQGRSGRQAGIIPALAGNTPGCVHVRAATGDHPRSRGEYLRFAEDVDTLHGSSPLSRGIHLHVAGRGLQSRIIPALAGNTGRAMNPFT